MQLPSNFNELHCQVSNFIYNNQFLANFGKSQFVFFNEHDHIYIHSLSQHLLQKIKGDILEKCQKSLFQRYCALLTQIDVKSINYTKQWQLKKTFLFFGTLEKNCCHNIFVRCFYFKVTLTLTIAKHFTIKCSFEYFQ